MQAGPEGNEAPPLVDAGDLLVVIGGSAIDTGLLRDLAARGATLVGADGGGDVIAGAGLTPDAIIGDFDSLADPGAWAGRTEMIRIDEQQTTDFEKCLYSTAAELTVALGMTGGRFDHTLSALDTATRYARLRKIVFVDEVDLAMALTGPFAFAVEPGARVSVHPLGPLMFESSEGLHYPLAGLRLGPGLGTGTSNRAVGGRFCVRPGPGETEPWLLILEKGYLGALIDAVLAGNEPGA